MKDKAKSLSEQSCETKLVLTFPSTAVGNVSSCLLLVGNQQFCTVQADLMI